MGETEASFPAGLEISLSRRVAAIFSTFSEERGWRRQRDSNPCFRIDNPAS